MTWIQAISLIRLVMRFAFPELKALLVFLDGAEELAAREQVARIVAQRRGELAGAAAKAGSDSTTKVREQKAGESARASSAATKTTLLLALIALSCSVARSGEAGDEQARAWQPPWPECETIKTVECPAPGGVLKLRESCTETIGCELSKLVVLGEHGATVNHIEPAGKTRAPGYVDWIRSDAPHNVTVRDTVVNGEGYTNAVFVGSGSTFVTLDNVHVSGADEVQVYVAAETSRIRITGSRIGVGKERCSIAWDSSDFFRLYDSYVDGCVETYRNCGENGRTRHTTSSRGRIQRNSIGGDVLIGSREGGKLYCAEDYRIDGPGSSGDDGDWSRNVYIQGNAIGGSVVVGETSSVVEGEPGDP